ncbi:hypothetical protein EGI20_04040 [Aquitalea sp. S1-19]|nr:hypothetical protein [Aquitalea sp. S1-19]
MGFVHAGIRLARLFAVYMLISVKLAAHTNIQQQSAAHAIVNFLRGHDLMKASSLDESRPCSSAH